MLHHKLTSAFVIFEPQIVKKDFTIFVSDLAVVLSFRKQAIFKHHSGHSTVAYAKAWARLWSDVGACLSLWNKVVCVPRHFFYEEQKSIK
jgi:hypothetical protein